MIEHFDQIPAMRIRGREEMRELALSAFTALAEADLLDEMDALNKRVFARGADAICETAVLEDDLWQWNFTPMVELVLREIADVAARQGLSERQRRDRIDFALSAAGY